MAYTTGMNTRVISVEVSSPPITTRAIGTCSSDPSPRPSAIGVRPRMVVIVVIMIGRSRRPPAVMTESMMPYPWSRRSWFV